MKTPAQKLEEMLKNIEAMPSIDLSSITPPVKKENEKENESNDFRSILITEIAHTKKEKRKKEKKEDDDKEQISSFDNQTPVEYLEPITPPLIEPKSLKTGYMRRRTDIKVPEGVKSVSSANRMPMASSQIDQILAGMMSQPSIVSRQRSNLTNSYKPFENKEQSVLSENLKAKVLKLLNHPKYKGEINKMKKEISGNNDHSRKL